MTAQPADTRGAGALRVDVALSATGATDQRTAAAHAEAAGYDGLWVGEVAHDPFLQLTLAATVTQRLELGTSIALAFARSPMTLATTANDLQQISGGRLRLGLGTQVKAHITRRFSMPWSRPADRMREFVLALRAIWGCWAAAPEGGAELDFAGEFYQFSLMPPQFVPPPNKYGPPPVLLAAVGPALTQVAGEVADGLVCHGFTTARYLHEVTLPALRRGHAGSIEGLEVIGHPMIVTGRTEEELTVAIDTVRAQIAFYASTPAYRGVLERHGWGGLGEELHELSRQRRWAELPGLIGDDVLAEFAVVGSPPAVAAELARRYTGLFTRCVLHTPYAAAPEVLDEIATLLRARSAS